MALPLYLAMIAAEMNAISPLPPKCAYMACHFAPYGAGLSNGPKALPPGSMLILNDRIPIHGHDPELIGKQLTDMLVTYKCSGLLLDFQRPGCEETTRLVKYLLERLPCPVGVSDCYGKELTCPIFLPAPPLDIPISEYLLPWKGREIWLEAALDGTVITLTETGSVTTPLPVGETYETGHCNPRLHCHYRIHTEDTLVRFTLFRTREDLDALLKEAEALGVTNAVGLYQELYIP